MPDDTAERLARIEAKLDRVMRLVELAEQLVATTGGPRGKLLGVLMRGSRS